MKRKWRGFWLHLWLYWLQNYPHETWVLYLSIFLQQKTRDLCNYPSRTLLSSQKRKDVRTSIAAHCLHIRVLGVLRFAAARGEWYTDIEQALIDRNKKQSSHTTHLICRRMAAYDAAEHAVGRIAIPGPIAPDSVGARRRWDAPRPLHSFLGGRRRAVGPEVGAKHG